jgi:hypothetical protein
LHGHALGGGALVGMAVGVGLALQVFPALDPRLQINLETPGQAQQGKVIIGQ